MVINIMLCAFLVVSVPEVIMIVSRRLLFFLFIHSFLFLVRTSSSIPVFADTVPEMVTDRPDQTESTATVPKGMVQVDTGLVSTDTGVSTVLEIPGTLVRIGVHEKLELRVGTAGWIRDDDLDIGGFGDSELGFKLRLCDEAGWMPDTAVLAGISAPTGNDDFTTDEWDPSIRFAAAHTINELISFGWNVAAEWSSSLNSSGETATLAVMPYSGAFGFGLSGRLGCFAELFGEVPVNAEDGPTHMADAGITYLVMNNFQLDLAAGAGLNDNADDWFVLGGITYRLPR